MPHTQTQEKSTTNKEKYSIKEKTKWKFKSKSRSSVTAKCEIASRIFITYSLQTNIPYTHNDTQSHTYI